MNRYMNFRIFILFIGIGFLTSCAIFQKENAFNKQAFPPEETVSLIILQVNDFYEIAALDQGQVGGAARIAGLRKKLLQENPNVLTVMAGDFLSPSLIGTLKWEGERIKGKQMVDVMNLVGFDLVTFGNHEFDIDEASLQKRINESSFEWVSSNVQQVVNDTKQSFYKEVNGHKTAIPETRILPFSNKNGAVLKIGIVAPCLPANKVNFVYYKDVFQSVSMALTALANTTDLQIALSHLNMEDDIKMAKLNPALDLIMGGHEHENMKHQIGSTVLTKADANAKSVYVHRISYNVASRKSSIISSLVKLDASIVPDAEVAQLVSKWKGIENKVIREMGFDPDEELVSLHEPYDARELTLRNKPAAFCEMISKAMLVSTKMKADAAIMNSGSVRVDDMLSGKLSQYDILRALPYGGSILELDITGALLKKVLDIGWANQGSGGYLQWSQISRTKNAEWLIHGEVLNSQKSYHIAVNDFLLTGLEKNLDFLTPKNPEITNVSQISSYPASDLRKDVRLAVIDYLKKGGR